MTRSGFPSLRQGLAASISPTPLVQLAVMASHRTGPPPPPKPILLPAMADGSQHPPPNGGDGWTVAMAAGAQGAGPRPGRLRCGQRKFPVRRRRAESSPWTIGGGGTTDIMPMGRATTAGRLRWVEATGALGRTMVGLAKASMELRATLWRGFKVPNTGTAVLTVLTAGVGEVAGGHLRCIRHLRRLQKNTEDVPPMVPDAFSMTAVAAPTTGLQGRPW